MLDDEPEWLGAPGLEVSVADVSVTESEGGKEPKQVAKNDFDWSDEEMDPLNLSVRMITCKIHSGYLIFFP